MKLRSTETEGVGVLLLSLWLIATAVLLLSTASFANEAVILAVLAVAAGVLLVFREGNLSASRSASRPNADGVRRGRGVSANLGVLVLSLWLIVTAVLFLTKNSVANQEMILAALAVAAGVLLLMRRGGMFGNVGWLLLSIWLIAQGAMILFSVSFNQSGVIMAALGLVAGILMLLRR